MFYFWRNIFLFWFCSPLEFLRLDFRFQYWPERDIAWPKDVTRTSLLLLGGEGWDQCRKKTRFEKYGKLKEGQKKNNTLHSFLMYKKDFIHGPIETSHARYLYYLLTSGFRRQLTREMIWLPKNRPQETPWPLQSSGGREIWWKEEGCKATCTVQEHTMTVQAMYNFNVNTKTTSVNKSKSHKLSK